MHPSPRVSQEMERCGSPRWDGGPRPRRGVVFCAHPSPGADAPADDKPRPPPPAPPAPPPLPLHSPLSPRPLRNRGPCSSSPQAAAALAQGQTICSLSLLSWISLVKQRSTRPRLLGRRRLCGCAARVDRQCRRQACRAGGAGLGHQRARVVREVRGQSVCARGAPSDSRAKDVICKCRCFANKR